MTSSVLLACYNGENFILEQLESIKNQSHQPDEVIICDDCSTDNTLNIVKDYIEHEGLHSWKLIENENNLGWKANFAKLTLMATKDVIFYSDQDDIWYEKKIGTMLNQMSEHTDIKLLVSDLNVVYMTENTEMYVPEDLGNNYYQHLKQKAKWSRILRPGCVFAAEREFAQECFKNNWQNGLAHDLLLWQYAFCRKKIGYLKEPLINWRRFETSATSGKIDSKAEFRIVENQIFLKSFEAAQKGLAVVDKPVKKCFTLEKKRAEFFRNKKIRTWLSCLLYIDCYPKKRSWLADLVYIKL